MTYTDVDKCFEQDILHKTCLADSTNVILFRYSWRNEII